MAKRKVKRANKEDVLVHARISNPMFVRKTLLEGAIIGAEVLKGYERIKKLEVKKKRYRVEVKKILKELKELVGELESERLPKVPHVAHPKQTVPKEKLIQKEILEREVVKQERKRPKVLHRTHTDSLNDEIRRLQDRINKL